MLRRKPEILVLYLSMTLALIGVSACNRGRDVAAAREDRLPAVSTADQNFMIKATQANLSEIDAARLAMQKSDNSDVRDYAHMIQSEHTNALDNLTNLMKDTGVAPPRAIPPEAQGDIDKMRELSGPDFDREFINMMVADHQKAVTMFREEIGTAQNSDVKKYAEDVLPKLEMHLEKAQHLQSNLFGGAKK
jgi:putative membrane protein